MRDPRYPLAAALTQRDHARDRAQAELEAARTRQAQAAAAKRETEARVHAHEQERRELLGHAQSPRTSGANLSRSGAYSARLNAELATLRQQLRAAELALVCETQAVRTAEQALLDAHAQHEVIERHHDRFRESTRRAHDKAQELETEEQQLSRSGIRRV